MLKILQKTGSERLKGELALLIDWHTHPFAHGEEEVKPCQNRNILKEFASRAEAINLDGLGFSDHSYYLDSFNFDNLLYLKNSCQNISIKIGIEFDYFPEKENEIRDIIASYPFDYTIGSVHHIGDWNFDHPDYKFKFSQKSLFELYRDYYRIIEKAAESRLFNIIGHLDLIKIYDYRLADKNQEIDLVIPALKKIAENDIAVEINTNGLNKPVEEFYPSDYILKMIGELNIPVVLGSDAHSAERVGENFAAALDKMQKFGLQRTKIFSGLKTKDLML